MAKDSTSDAVPPIEPTPVVGPPAVPAAAVPPPPPPPVVAQPGTVDPYAGSAQNPPPPGVVGYAPANYQTGYYAQPQPAGLAIASMVTGIVGVFLSLFEGFGFLPSLAAVITGHLARKRQPHARGMWLTGLICGYIGLGFSLIWFVVIAIFIGIGISAAVSGTDLGY